MHDKAAHSASAPAKLKLDPPKLDLSCNSDQWSAFTRQWEMYKAGMIISPGQASTALFYCCSDDLRTDVMRDLRGDVVGMAESDLMAAIKRLAVREESVLVHRIRLSKMVQPPGTSIRIFLASLRGRTLPVHSLVYTTWMRPHI